MKLGRSIGLSLNALFAHRIRAMLSVSSVVAGVAAVLVASAIGAGVEADIRARIEAIGANLLVVRPAQVKRLVARAEVKGSVTTLRLEDLASVATLPRVAAAVPGIEAGVRVKAGSSAMNTKVLGTRPEFPAVRRFAVARGRFFDADDDKKARRVAVLGARVADALFEKNPVGQPIRIRQVPFEVIGVLASKGVVAGGDEDNQVIVPVQTALRRVFNVTWLSAIFVSVADAAEMTSVQRDIVDVLRRAHRLDPDAPADFEVQNAAAFLALQRQTAATLGRLATGVTAVALVVGGTGILALMWLSVKERTGEIGLRMAVGAQPRDILVQFLFEATFLALAGWTGGLLLAVAAAVGVAIATPWHVGIPWQAVLVSLAMALIIGSGFGAVPARRASRIPPIRALRLS